LQFCRATPPLWAAFRVYSDEAERVTGGVQHHADIGVGFVLPVRDPRADASHPIDRRVDVWGSHGDEQQAARSGHSR